MIRRSFNLAAAASVLLFLAVAAVWVRSHWVGTRWASTRVDRAAGSLTFAADRVDVGAGGVGFVGQRATVAETSREYGVFQAYARPASWVEQRALATYPSGPTLQPSPPSFDRLGLQWGAAAAVQGGVAYDRRWVIVPMWVPAVAFALLPLGWLAWRVRRARARRSRLRGGLCLACGFDMRSTPVRCPECGTTSAGLDRLFDQIDRAEAGAAYRPVVGQVANTGRG